MANIRKIYEDDAQTQQIMPQTSEKAVIDGNGTTAETKFGMLFEAYDGLTQSDIIVVADHTAVVNPSANTIYREQGVNSYSDWMYYDGAWKKMATYDNGIDNTPTKDSNNLVKSSGIYDAVSVDYKQVHVRATYTDNSVTFIGTLTIQRSEGGEVSAVTSYIGRTFTLTGTQRLVVHKNNAVEVVETASDVLSTDIVLLGISSELNKFSWGALYPLYIEYISTKKDEIRIYPKLEYGAIAPTSGNFGSGWYGKQYVRTPLYTSTHPKSIVRMLSDIDVQIRIYWYEEDYSFRSYNDFADMEAAEEKEVTIPDGVYFFRCYFRKNANLDNLPLFNFSIYGDFQLNNQIYNVRPSNGNQHLTITVNAAKCGSTNTTTSNVQDNEELYSDFGLLSLPSSYSNTGKPTRLIIYCHGSATHYTQNTTTWPSQSISPEYFLSCGYAVMDIDGEIYYHNSTYKHNYSIQGVQSYIAAYDWVVNNYNICKDGVFLGGRSLGAMQVINLLYKTSIPVIAACCIAPGVTPLHAMNFCSALQRQYTAEKMGMTGTAPSWTSNNPMTSSELEYFKCNWEKFYMWSPVFGIVQNLPDKETMLSAGMSYATSTTTPPEAEKNVYDALIAKLRVPLKIFVATNDTTNPPACCSDYLYRMLANGGSYVEERKLPAGGHYPEFESSQLVSYTDTFGNQLSNVSVVYIEMLQFWRRYEKWQ